MMEVPTRDDILRLGSGTGRFHVSIYLPTAQKGVETLQNSTRLKNLLREAEHKLVEFGNTADAAGKQLVAVRDLVDNFEFFQHQSEGLAIFVQPDGTVEKYRIPIHVDERVHVNDRFYVKPLMQVLNSNGRFFLLTISQKELRLFEGDRFALRQMKLPEGTPTSVEEAMKYEDWERGHHFSPGGQGRNAGGVQAFQGHGADAADKERAKKDVLQFLQMADKGLKALIGQESAPLLLAGPEYVHHIAREALSYSHIMKNEIHKQVDGMSLQDLHSLAWTVVAPFFDQTREQAVERYNELRVKGLASCNIIEVVPAAAEGRIDTLLVSASENCWGTFEEDSRKVKVATDEKSANGEDLLDLAALQALRTGARVYAVEVDDMPDPTPVAAVFRY